MVEANGASRSLFTKGYKYLFAVLAPANLYLDVAIDLAVEKNNGKPVSVAMAFEQDAFSQDVRLGVLDAIKRTGSKKVIDDKLPKELNDMAATLAKVKAVKPDVLVLWRHITVRGDGRYRGGPRAFGWAADLAVRGAADLVRFPRRGLPRWQYRRGV